MSLTSSGNARPTWSTPRLYPKSDGALVTDFAENFSSCVKGVRAGEPLVLTGWQSDLLDNLFERRPDGLLRYRRQPCAD
jgi:hypothetical protein